MRIEAFQGDYRFLSNFYHAPVYLDHELYPTVEHAYQAAKTDNPVQRAAIRRAKTPGIAKALGRKATLVSNWNTVKLEVMRSLLFQKFAYEPMRSRLLATGNDELIEGNYWHDYYWGVCNGKGQNHLGKLLMQIRERLKP